MTLPGSAGFDTYRTGRYPNFDVVGFPVDVPWQRRQFSYWFCAGTTGVIPSLAEIPFTPVWDGRMSGGGVNVVTCCAPCGLWQSAQVAWRLLFRRIASARVVCAIPRRIWMIGDL